MFWNALVFHDASMVSLPRSSMGNAPFPKPHSDRLGSRVHVDHLLAIMVTRTEKLFAWLRGAFCLSLVGLFFATADYGGRNFTVQAVFEGLVVVLGLGCSIWILFLRGKALMTPSAQILATVVDAGITTVGLMTNAVDPSPDYQGVFGSLDVGVVLLVMLTPLFRINSNAMWVSALAHVMGLWALVCLDARQGVAFPLNKAMIFGIFWAAALGMGLILTRLTRQGALNTATSSTRAERARSGVFALLHEHHDLRSVLFDLRLNLERIGENSQMGRPTEELVERVTSRLNDFSHSLDSTRDRAMAALKGLERPEAAALVEVFAGLRRQFIGDTVELALSEPEPTLAVMYGGGRGGLELTLAHLVSNAEKASTAGRVRVAIDAGLVSNGLVRISIQDDGPGFPETALAWLGKRPGARDKQKGSGLGLWLASGAAGAVGGRLILENGSNGGALVTMLLPFAST